MGCEVRNLIEQSLFKRDSQGFKACSPCPYTARPGRPSYTQARIQDFLQGGSTTAVYSGRLWRLRRPGGGGGSRVDKHQIKVHSIHKIFRAIILAIFCYS